MENFVKLPDKKKEKFGFGTRLMGSALGFTMGFSIVAVSGTVLAIMSRRPLTQEYIKQIVKSGCAFGGIFGIGAMFR